MTEELAPIRTYSKSEMARLYDVNVRTFVCEWLPPFMKELKKLGYGKKKQQKIFTIAQVRYLWRDDVLGHPNKK
ncbi:MAG: hypothetical protein WBO10_01975 [Pyrinomonadaceae bacterium]